MNLHGKQLKEYITDTGNSARFLIKILQNEHYMPIVVLGL